MWFRGLQTLVFNDEDTPAGFKSSGAKKFSQGKLMWKWFLCKYRHKAARAAPPEMFHEYVRREVRKSEMMKRSTSDGGMMLAA